MWKGLSNTEQNICDGGPRGPPGTIIVVNAFITLAHRRGWVSKSLGPRHQKSHFFFFDTHKKTLNFRRRVPEKRADFELQHSGPRGRLVRKNPLLFYTHNKKTLRIFAGGCPKKGRFQGFGCREPRAPGEKKKKHPFFRRNRLKIN